VRDLHCCPTRRSSDLWCDEHWRCVEGHDRRWRHRARGGQLHMSTVRVRYVGLKPREQDHLYGTGIWWEGAGDVKDVPADKWPLRAEEDTSELPSLTTL